MTIFSLKQPHGVPIKLKVVIKCMAPRPHAFYDYFQLEMVPCSPNQARSHNKMRGAQAPGILSLVCREEFQSQEGFPKRSFSLGKGSPRRVSVLGREFQFWGGLPKKNILKGNPSLYFKRIFAQNPLFFKQLMARINPLFKKEFLARILCLNKMLTRII